MKKIIIILISIVIFCNFSMAQSKNTKFDEDNLYHKALIAVLEKRASDYINITERKSLYNVIIAKEIRAIELPQEIKEFKIDYLDGEELYRKFIEYKKTKSKDERGELEIMFVHPMENKGSKIEVRFTDHWYRRKKNNTFLALEGGSIVTFVFDCKTEKFIVENVELWGV